MRTMILALGLAMCVGQVQAQTPPGRIWHSMSSNGATTSDASRVYMHGGDDGAAATFYLNDLWYYHVASGTWTQVTPSGRTWPKVGRGKGAFSCGAGKCVLFAGQLGTKRVNETWYFTEPAGNATSVSWTQVSCKKPSSCPSPRELPLVAFDPTRGYHVSFGGETTDYAAMNDTWTFSGSSWTKRLATASPPARWAGSAAFVPSHVSNGANVPMDKVVIFGGDPYPNPPYPAALCDLHAWTGSTWQAITASNQGPYLSLATMAWDAGNGTSPPHLIVSGGYASWDGNIPNSETWHFTFNTSTTGSWAKATSSSCAPIRDARGAFDVPSRNLVFFGGSDGNLAVYDDTLVCR